MPRPKGIPKTGGRKKGSRNKASAQRAVAAAKAGLLPHEFLLAVSRGETIDGYKPTFADRVDAASKAAPFYAARLAATQHTGAGGGPITIVDLKALSDEQLEALRPVLEQLAASQDAEA